MTVAELLAALADVPPWYRLSLDLDPEARFGRLLVEDGSVILALGWATVEELAPVLAGLDLQAKVLVDLDGCLTSLSRVLRGDGRGLLIV